MRRSGVPIQNLIFDLGNVIVDLDIQASEDLFFKHTGISFMTARGSDLKTFDDYECGLIPEAVFLNHFLKKSHKLQAGDMISAWNAMLVDIPLQRVLMLKKLSTKYRVYILSNTNETHIRWVDRYLQERYEMKSFDEVVHKAFYSHQLHARKPDVEIYQKVIARTGVVPNETLFFDDNEMNVMAAHTLGVHAEIVSPGDEIVDLLPEILIKYGS